jgi:hypothetical protein
MKKKNTKNSDYSLAHVLYQKLGNDWYAFTEVDGDCFMTKVDPDATESREAATEHEEQISSRKRNRAA